MAERDELVASFKKFEENKQSMANVLDLLVDKGKLYHELEKMEVVRDKANKTLVHIMEEDVYRLQKCNLELFKKKVELSQKQESLRGTLVDYRKTIEDFEQFLNYYHDGIKKLQADLKKSRKITL